MCFVDGGHATTPNQLDNMILPKLGANQFVGHRHVSRWYVVQLNELTYEKGPRIPGYPIYRPNRARMRVPKIILRITLGSQLDHYWITCSQKSFAYITVQICLGIRRA